MFKWVKILFVFSAAMSLILSSIPRCGNVRALLETFAIVEGGEESCHHGEESEVNENNQTAQIDHHGCRCSVFKCFLAPAQQLVSSVTVPSESNPVFVGFNYSGNQLNRTIEPLRKPPRLV